MAPPTETSHLAYAALKKSTFTFSRTNIPCKVGGLTSLTVRIASLRLAHRFPIGSTYFKQNFIFKIGLSFFH